MNLLKGDPYGGGRSRDCLSVVLVAAIILVAVLFFALVARLVYQ